MNHNEATEDLGIPPMNMMTESHLIILKHCLERKKIGWEVLKGWDENSKHNLQVNKELIESLFLRLENTLRESYKRYDLIFSFFDKFLLEIKGGSQLEKGISLFKLGNNVLKSKSQMSKTEIDEREQREPYMLTIAQFNNEFKEFETKLKKNTERMQKEINKKILAEHIRPYENNIKALYVKIEIRKKNLAKRSSETTDKLKVFSKQFKEVMITEEKRKRAKVNILDSAFDFVKSVRQIDMSLTDFGLLLIALWEQCRVLEEKRITAVGNAIEKFVELLSEIFGNEAKKSFSKTIQRLQDLKVQAIIDNIFHYGKYLRKNEQQLIWNRVQDKPTNYNVEPKAQFNSEHSIPSENDKSVTPNDSEDKKCQSEQVINKSLPKKEKQDIVHLKKFFLSTSAVMKENRINYFRIKQWSGCEGKGKRSPKKMIIFLSVDFYYSIYIENKESKSNDTLKLKASFQVEKCDAFAKREKSEIVLTYVEKGFLWNSKKTVYIKMPQEQVEDFLMYYQQAYMIIDSKERMNWAKTKEKEAKINSLQTSSKVEHEDEPQNESSPNSIKENSTKQNEDNGSDNVEKTLDPEIKASTKNENKNENGNEIVNKNEKQKENKDKDEDEDKGHPQDKPESRDKDN